MIAKGSRGTEVGPEDPLRLQIPKLKQLKKKVRDLRKSLCLVGRLGKNTVAEERPAFDYTEADLNSF